MRAIPGVLLVTLLAACSATGPPHALRDAPEPGVMPAEVMANPSAHEGERVVWGGRITAIDIDDGESFITVRAQPLDEVSLEPKAGTTGGARFVARFQRYLDPVLYSPGGVITVAGRVRGSRAATLWDDTAVPVVSVTGYKRWQPDISRRWLAP